MPSLLRRLACSNTRRDLNKLVLCMVVQHIVACEYKKLRLDVGLFLTRPDATNLNHVTYIINIPALYLDLSQ